MTLITHTTEHFYSFTEYLNYDDGTNNPYELVAGRLLKVNPPTFRHLLVADFLQEFLKGEIKRGQTPWVCLREASIRTGLNRARLSDICVISATEIAKFLDQSAVCEVAPLLVIEIVSPSSIAIDYRYKPSEYAALGISEYWIVDPLTSKISVLIWEEGWYEESIFTNTQPLISSLFPNIILTPDQVFSAGNLGKIQL